METCDLANTYHGLHIKSFDKIKDAKKIINKMFNEYKDDECEKEKKLYLKSEEKDLKEKSQHVHNVLDKQEQYSQGDRLFCME